MIIIRGVDELVASVGRAAVSEWRPVTQEAIDRFAEATGDRNPLHVDPEFARRTPFGSTIAHGYFLMGAAPALMAELWRLEAFAFTVAYGVDRIRFPAPLPVDTRFRMRLSVDGVDRIDGGAQITAGLTFEREGGGKPVCVAESLYRVYA